MENYKELYYFLFNQITDIIEQLKSIQQQSEEMFITFEENNFDPNSSQK
ncbi:MAG: hypothetical protein J6Q18_03240 [Oscillospiraceae bacterium]|nr:hypothetical protein [Oscillospiraceae bacterium]